MKQVLIRQNEDDSKWHLADARDGMPFHFHSYTTDYLEFDSEDEARAYFARMNDGEHELITD
jgi:uncharacterized glyoxalase superfamily protein PhnB